MSEEKVRVLYIDDEVNNLHSFKAAFRKEYDISIAQSAEEAMKILENDFFHVIISDQRMPGKTGVEFFEFIVEKFPDPVRILLTGYADIQAVIDAINKGEVYRFIDKPWDYQSVRVAIKNAYEVYETRQLLQKYNEELVKAYDELDKFVYSVSHDLRAPLTSILGLVKLARNQEHQQSPEVEIPEIDYLNLIEKSVDKLDIFIRNIIDYYRSTRMESLDETIDFNEILDSTKQGLAYYPDFATIEIHMEVENPQQVPFKSDHSRLRIIFNNIVSNAIKYQRPEEPASDLFIRVTISSENAEIKFMDNGIGINEKHLSEIFKMFFRASNVNAGSGIGLYIVKEAVQKLGGTIEAESVQGSHTLFSLMLPNHL